MTSVTGRDLSPVCSRHRHNVQYGGLPIIDEETVFSCRFAGSFCDSVEERLDTPSTRFSYTFNRILFLNLKQNISESETNYFII